MKTLNNRTKRRLGILLFAGALLASAPGCMFPKAKKFFSKNVNLAGAMTHSPNSFGPTQAGTIRLRSEELWYRRNFSGDKTTFLWGLFTYTDY